MIGDVRKPVDEGSVLFHEGPVLGIPVILESAENGPILGVGQAPAAVEVQDLVHLAALVERLFFARPPVVSDAERLKVLLDFVQEAFHGERLGLLQIGPARGPEFCRNRFDIVALVGVVLENLKPAAVDLGPEPDEGSLFLRLLVDFMPALLALKGAAFTLQDPPHHRLSEHLDLVAGVVDVEFAGYLVAGEVEEVGNRVADGGLPSVGDVERSGGVGRAVFDQHLPPRAHRRAAVVPAFC